MKRFILYVLGEPGVGKTTLVRHLLRDAMHGETDNQTYTEKPLPKWTIVNDVVAAGHYRGWAFDGADTIPYNGARAALEYWRDWLDGNARLTIFDGQRFATKPSLGFLRESGIPIMGVHLVGSEAAIVRRAARCASAGTEPQSKNWVKGAATGARNFAETIGAFEIDATLSSLEIAGQVTELIAKARV